MVENIKFSVISRIFSGSSSLFSVHMTFHLTIIIGENSRFLIIFMRPFLDGMWHVKHAIQMSYSGKAAQFNAAACSWYCIIMKGTNIPKIFFVRAIPFNHLKSHFFFPFY